MDRQRQAASFETCGRVRQPLRSPWLAAVLLVGFAIPLAAAAASGNLAIPHSDSWSYSRIAQDFARTGQIQLLGWNRASLVGQLVLLAPFASSLVAQQVAVSVLGLAGLIAAYLLLADHLGERRAAFGVGLIAVWPGWATLSTWFFTDVPALAGSFIALAVGQRSLKTGSRLWFWIAIGVGLWATTVREQALAAPLALLLAAWFERSPRWRMGRRQLLAGAALFVAATIAFLAWRNSLPRGDHPPYLLSITGDLHALILYAVQSCFTLAVAIAPAVLWTAAPWRWRRASWLLSGATTVVFGAVLLGGSKVLADWFYDPVDATLAISSHSASIGGAVHDLLLVLALLSGALLAGALREGWWRAGCLLGSFTAITFVGVVLAAAVGQGIYDRYLIALVPGVLLVVLGAPRTAPGEERWRWPARGRAPATLVVTLALSCLSASMAAQLFASDRATWRAGEAATRTGVGAQRVDAGMAWQGWHAPNGVVYRRIVISPRYGWWAGFFARLAPCVVIYTDRAGAETATRAGFTPLHTISYRRYLLFGTANLFVFATHAPGCPAVAPLG